MKIKIKTTKQFVILMTAAVADFIWMCLPGWIVMTVCVSYGPVDGALGKEWGFFLAVALGLAVMLLWIPTSDKISMPLIRKLAKRIGATSDEED